MGHRRFLAQLIHLGLHLHQLALLAAFALETSHLGFQARDGHLHAIDRSAVRLDRSRRHGGIRRLSARFFLLKLGIW